MSADDIRKWVVSQDQADRAEFARRLRDHLVDADRERFFELYLNSASFKAMVTSLADGLVDVLNTMAQVAEGEREVRAKMAQALDRAMREGVKMGLGESDG